MDKNKVIEAASKLIAKGQLEKAVREFQRVLEVDPDDVRILQKLAELYQKMQRREEAADCFEKVAKTYAAQGFYLKAVALYKQVLKVVDRIEVNVRLAELYQQLGLVGDATKEWQNVAAYYEKVGDLKSSLDTLRKLVDLDPDNVAARIRLGEQYARQDNLVEAVAELRRAAAYLQRNSRQDDYIRVAERISHLDQGDVALARELAENYLSRNDSKRALAKLQICFKANPRDLQTLQMLARAFQDLGQVSKTVSVLKELARVHTDGGRIEDAKGVYGQALALAPEDAEIKSSLKALEEQSAPPPQARPPTGPVAAGRPPSGPIAASRPPTGPVTAARPPPPPSQRSGQSAPGPISGPIAGQAQRPPTGPINPTSPITPAAARTGAPLTTPPQVSPLPAAPSQGQPMAPSPGARRQDAAAGPVSVPKLLKETEVYVKYGLHEKALEHLRKIFAVDPENLDAHEKAKTLALNMNRPADAAASLAMLVRFYTARSDPRAQAARAELQQIDPAHPALQGAGGSAAEEFAEEVEVEEAPPADREASAPPEAQDDDAEVDAEVVEEVGVDDISEVPADEAAAAGSAAAAPEDGAEVYSPDAQAAALERVSADDEVPVAPAAPEEPDQGEEDAAQAAVMVDNGYDDAIVSEPEEEFGARGAEEAPARPAAQASGHATGRVSQSGHSTGRVAQAAQATGPVRVPVEEDAFASDLAEVDFYLQAGLADDARAILEAILLAEPGHAEARRRLAELGGALPVEATKPVPQADFGEDAEQTMYDARPLAAAASPAQPPPPPSEPLPEGPSGSTGEHDALAAELAAELANDFVAEDGAEVPLDTGPMGDFQIPASDVIGEFRTKLQQVVRPEDAQTHYDLGIAYKEMGLIDEAIAEFELALRFGGGVRKVDCISVLAACAMERGKPDDAIAWLTLGLSEPGSPASTRRALGYELGQAYEAVGDTGLALAEYQNVERVEPGFRDVRDRILRMGGRISGPIKRPPQATRPPPAAGPGQPVSAAPPPRPAAPATRPQPPAGAMAPKPPPPPQPTASARPPPPPPASEPALPAAGGAEAASSAAQSSPEPTAEQRRNRKIGFV